MAQNWKKRYSFRLTEDDASIYKFLESLPDNKRSETIRYLLSMAIKYLNVERSQEEYFQQFMQELKEIQRHQTNQWEELRQELKNRVGHVTEEPMEEEKEGKMSDQAITDTANAFLSSFGMNNDN